MPLDSRLRGNDTCAEFLVIPAKAGIQGRCIEYTFHNLLSNYVSQVIEQIPFELINLNRQGNLIMRKRKLLAPVLLGLFLIGCAPLIFFGAGTAVGIVGSMYYRGALTVIYQAPYMETWDATLKAIDNMKFFMESKDHDSTKGKITARRPDDKPVTISLKYKTSQETEVMIRVGLLGDKGSSKVIKEEIRKVLFE